MILGVGSSTVVLLLILLMQTAAIGAIAFFAYKAGKSLSALDEVRKIIRTALPEVEEGVKQAQKFIRSLEEAGNHINHIAAELRESVEKARETTENVAEVFQETTERAERHIRRVDHLLTEAIDRTVATADYLSRTVYPQIVEVAALAKGIHATIEYLKGKRRFPIPDS